MNKGKLYRFNTGFIATIGSLDAVIGVVETVNERSTDGLDNILIGGFLLAVAKFGHDATKEFGQNNQNTVQ